MSDELLLIPHPGKHSQVIQLCRCLLNNTNDLLLSLELHEAAVLVPGKVIKQFYDTMMNYTFDQDSGTADKLKEQSERDTSRNMIRMHGPRIMLADLA